MRSGSPNLSDDEYRDSAREAFSRMDPEERAQFGQQLREQADQQGYGDFIDRDHDGQDDRFQDPDYLAQMTSSMHRKQPDIIGSLLGGMMGGGGAGLLSGMMGGGGTGGAHGASGGSGIMGNPIAKAAMSGIVAMAAKKMMGGR